MTNSQSPSLLELAERCEAATGPDRELDWLIANALGEIPKHNIREIGWDHTWYRKPDEFALWRVPGADQFAGVELWQPKPRTASLDAAMTLVPEGWQAERLGWWTGCEADCTLIETHWRDGTWVREADWLGRVKGEAATPPLALCAAALRASAAQ